MYFQIVSEITNIKTIAATHSIKDLSRLREQYGEERWRKLKGIAKVRLVWYWQKEDENKIFFGLT